MTQEDKYQEVCKPIKICYQLRIIVPVICIVSGIIALFLFGYFMVSAGRTAYSVEINNMFIKCPLDIFTLVIAVFYLILFSVIMDIFYYGSELIGICILL